jgi:hypothetical protein
MQWKLTNHPHVSDLLLCTVDKIIHDEQRQQSPKQNGKASLHQGVLMSVSTTQA